MTQQNTDTTGRIDEALSGAAVTASIERLVADSPIKSQLSARMLAEAAVLVRAQLRILSTRLLAGELGVEDAKTISGLTSNLKRLCDTLQVTAPADDELRF